MIHLFVTTNYHTGGVAKYEVATLEVRKFFEYIKFGLGYC